MALTRAECDLRDAEATRRAIGRLSPDIVFHLAARSSVAESWQYPREVLDENIRTTLNLLEAVRCETPQAAVLTVSSGEIYGKPDVLPTREDAPLRPQNPYAVSKAAGDLLAGQYADAHGLRIVRVRAFGHAGPGQAPSFALASFTRQAAAGLVARDTQIRILTGNPDSRRDYTDVRDVARAYRALVSAPPGVYNVCSGRSWSAGDIIAILRELVAPAQIEHVIDPALKRPHEILEIRGSYERLGATTGWRPEIAFEQTVRDTLEWWEAELRERGND